MRKLTLLAMLIVAAATVYAQAATVSLPGPPTHQAKVGWTAPSVCNSTTPCTFQVYRIAGACPAILNGSPGWTLVGTTAPQVGSYVDTTVSAGATYAYAIYPVQGSTQGMLGACGSGVIPNDLAPVTGVTIAAQ